MCVYHPLQYTHLHTHIHTTHLTPHHRYMETFTIVLSDDDDEPIYLVNPSTEVIDLTNCEEEEEEGGKKGEEKKEEEEEEEEEIFTIVSSSCCTSSNPTQPQPQPQTQQQPQPPCAAEMPPMVAKVCAYVATCTDARIVLLRNQEVVRWLFGDLSFLRPVLPDGSTNVVGGKKSDEDISSYKKAEDIWGRHALKMRRPDLALKQQWTNKFGEHICEELFSLLGKNVSTPPKKKSLVKRKRYQPDCEIDDAIIEVKTGTYYTTGTAHEKILGVPLKYAEVPNLYNKPVKILCIGGAEKMCREQYGILPDEDDGAIGCPHVNALLNVYKQNRIEYVGITTLLKSFVQDGL